MSAAASLADAWEQNAAENLPAGCDPLAVVMMRRCWYASAATTLKMTEGKTTREQLLAERVDLAHDLALAQEPAKQAALLCCGQLASPGVEATAGLLCQEDCEVCCVVHFLSPVCVADVFIVITFIPPSTLIS